MLGKRTVHEKKMKIHVYTVLLINILNINDRFIHIPDCMLMQKSRFKE